MLKKIGVQIILDYLRFLSRLQLAKNKHAIIIGVTGSAGKTSTRRAIAHILRGRGIVKQSVHANSQTGIPLNILGLQVISYTVLDWLRLIILAPLALIYNWEHFDYYVVEMGIDSPIEPKNMSYLLKIITPNIGVVLNAGLSHAAAFDHLVKDRDIARKELKLRQLIAKEKMGLARGINPSGVAIINLDQQELKDLSHHLKARTIYIGKSAKANLRIISSQVDRHGFKFGFTYQSQTYELTLPDIFSDSYVYTFASAIAVCAGLGISPSKSILALSNYRSSPGRMRIFGGINDSTIIDSSYNASPDPMKEALLLLHKLGGRARKIAVIGDMRELGDNTKQSHKYLANWIMHNCDETILFGEATGKHTLPVLQAAHFPVRHFNKMIELIPFLTKTIKPKSWILVKGSQNQILLERAVAAILKSPADLNLLCRRSSYWDKVRARTL